MLLKYPNIFHHLVLSYRKDLTKNFSRKMKKKTSSWLNLSVKVTTDGSQQSALDDVGNKISTFSLSDKMRSSSRFFSKPFIGASYIDTSIFVIVRLLRTKFSSKVVGNQVPNICFYCNCHGSKCRNERNSYFKVLGGLDSYEVIMYERGQHASMKSIPKARGIDNHFVDFIDLQCKDGKPPKQILDAVNR